ncbi:hypothetical protein JMJ35_009460 [Cladonia borealis]|uniref:RING-type domain-containing protein n=1 Tax=Cladonia borealis TaxID=184061 RepID=A0AA39U5S6_9LECA|nr:hypothetical protein JMJ35_009460 [Cladonia borealis]
MDPLVTRWNPSNVLVNIDNRSCNFTCVGYARTAGRRCHNTIAYANQIKAARLVAEMSRLDISSREITYLLEELAPLVLCRRWHQNQAADMVDDWQGEVDVLRHKTEAARRAEDEERRQDSRLQRAGERRVREAAQRAEELRHQQREAQQSDETPQAQEATLRAEEASSDQEAVNRIEIQQLRAMLASMCARLQEVEERNRELQHTITEQSERLPSRAVDQGAVSEADVLLAVPVSPTSTLGHHVEEEPALPAAATVERVEEDPTSPTISPNDQLPEEPQDSDNLTVEGDCSICLESLGSQNDVTRCIARCGQQFHRDCVGIWIVSGENTHTCPYCRADWVD